MFNDLSPYTIQQRHPVIGKLKVAGDANVAGRCTNGGFVGSQCGTNLSFGGQQLAFMAPGVQVLSTLDREYIPFGFLSTNCPSTANCDHYPPARNNMGAAGSQTTNNGLVGNYTNNNALTSLPGFASYTYLGNMTGTSQAAPHITGLVGLIRSINPLLSTKTATDPVSGGEIGELLSTNATAVQVNANDPWPCIDNTGQNGCGAGIPNAQKALEKSLGKIRNAQINNRLTPMFQLRVDASAALAPGFELEATLASFETWLSTSSAQVAMAAIEGKLYYVGDSNMSVGAGESFGTNQMQVYKAGFDNGANTNHVMPASQYRHRLYANPGFAQLPFASFYLFTTENAPAGNTLLPLYKMSSKCFGIRKHFYTTSTSTRDSYAAGPAQTGTSATGCITGSASTQRGYFFDGVEGYVLQQPAPGTVALNIGYKSSGTDGNDGWALYTAAEATRFSSYNQNVATLGYVYPAVAWNNGLATYNDQDGDGLSDGYEIGMKLNEQSVDGDCDGIADGVEFPIAGISNSDPMQSTNCADLRIARQGNNYIVSNPVGPSIGVITSVKFQYLVPTIPSNPQPALPTGPGWTCVPEAPPPNSPMDLQIRSCTSASNQLSVGVSVTFSVPNYGGATNLVGPTIVTVYSSTPDPVLSNNSVQ